jgi:hypothetical protein
MERGPPIWYRGQSRHWHRKIPGCKRLRRMAKQGAVQGVVGVADVRVVEDVEELGSKTKPHAVLPGN